MSFIVAGLFVQVLATAGLLCVVYFLTKLAVKNGIKEAGLLEALRRTVNAPDKTPNAPPGFKWKLIQDEPEWATPQGKEPKFVDTRPS